MARDLHLAPDLRDLPIGADQESCAFNAHIVAAVHRFFDPDSERFADCSTLVAAQCNVQIIFADEFRMAFDRVLRDADNIRPGLDEVRSKRRKVLCFPRAAGRIILGIELEHQTSALVIGNLGRVTLNRQVGNIRRIIARLQHVQSPFGAAEMPCQNLETSCLTVSSAASRLGQSGWSHALAIRAQVASDGL